MTTKVDITGSIPKATEIAFIFDTTGSMSPAIANVRKHIEKTCEELFKDIPNLKIGLISHGDYCDGDHCYNVQMLTDDQSKIFNFIHTTPNTSGGDSPECYELALNLAKTLGWSDKKGGKVVVMIGDAEPHDVNYAQNRDKLDWKKELADLKGMGINVYPLQCLYSTINSGANAFWKAVGEAMDTPLLKLQDFNEASTAIKSFAHASSGTRAFAAYEKKLADTGETLSGSMVMMNSTLRDESAKYDVMEEIPSTDTPSPAPKPVAKKPKGRPRKKKL